MKGECCQEVVLSGFPSGVKGRKDVGVVMAIKL